MSTYKRRDRKFEEHIAQLVDAKIPVKYHCVCRNYQGECEDECAEFNAKRDPTHLPSKYSWVSLKDWLRVLLCSLLWRLGPIPGTATYIALPLLIILLICSLRALVGGALQFDMGICAKFMGLALLLTLNLRRVGIGRVVETLFVLANVVNIAFGIAILIGTDWVTDFLPKFYW